MLEVKIHHDIKDYSWNEWCAICSQRVQQSQQDPDTGFCYGVFV